METVFITSGLLIAILFFTANYLVKGIGGMSAPLQQVGMFLLNKAPAGIIDLFSDEAGSGSKTWIRFGMVWFIFAAISSFLGLWHSYDGTALDSLASIGWSYDDGSMLTEYTNVFFMTALNYMLVGGALVAVSRTAQGRLASEKSASMVALLLTVSTAAYLFLPVLLSFVTLDNEAGIIDTVTDVSSLVVGSLLHAAILINVLITVANRASDNLSPTTWFLVWRLLQRLPAASWPSSANSCPPHKPFGWRNMCSLDGFHLRSSSGSLTTSSLTQPALQFGQSRCSRSTCFCCF